MTRIVKLCLLFALTFPSRGLEWAQHSGYRSAPAVPNPAGQPGFSLLPSAQTGISFTNHLADASAARNRIFENGSGVALGDIDGDGWCDIYFCQLEGPNTLYRNLGNWRFQDITEPAGVACTNQYSTGAVFADIDGDGDLDLLVNSMGGGTRAFLNDGKGRFSELTGTRLVRRFGSTSMALADIDGDGDLDLYVANYRTDTYKDRPPGLTVEARMVDGKVVVNPPDRFIPITPRAGGMEVLELGERDFLYLNDGSGRFAPVSWTTGSFLNEDGKPLSEPPKDWGLAVMFRDFDGDGTPDLYVCNDFFHSPDQFWLNKGGFRAVARTAVRNMSLSSMAIDVADINRDGFDDFFVVDMLSRDPENRQRQRPNMMKGLISDPIQDPNFRPEVPRNTLYLNRGDGTYAEIAPFSGLAATEWSWGAIFLDVDLDGFEDLIIAAGNNHDVQDADALRQIAAVRGNESALQRLNRFPRIVLPRLAYRNQRDLTFEDVSLAWGFDIAGIAHGMAHADLDNDGDLDLVCNMLNDSAAIYRNNSAAPRIGVRLKGKPSNTHGIGAKIRVLGGPVPQSQEIICGGRYLSGDDAMRVFAAGAGGSLSVEVTWRSGLRTLLTNLAPNQIYEVDESSARPKAPSPLVQKPPALFKDQSQLIGQTYTAEAFDDFSRQPLLWRKLSDLAPGTSWIDVNEDGWDDLVLPAGKGSQLALFLNNQKGGFVRSAVPFEKASDDQTTVLSWPQPGHVLIGNSNYKTGDSNVPAIVRLNTTTGKTDTLAPGSAASVGPIALADIDHDGDLDVFMGARIAPGKYPEPVSSFLYRNEAGTFRNDEKNSKLFDRIGLVSSATFADLDRDGWTDLILACEWGPLKLFHNDKGTLIDDTTRFGLDGLTGWWNGVAIGDFDEDGRLDLIASNWGRNTLAHPSKQAPLRIFFADLDANGITEFIETYPDGGKDVPLRDYETVGASLPFLLDRFPTYRAYGQASISNLLGGHSSNFRGLQASSLDTTLFLNRGDRFEVRSLPAEAQFSPAFGVSVADFDGDGHQDVFLAQNYFGVEPETARYDAGRGLLLKGDGKGNLSPMGAELSGIEIYGEQRGCAVTDFDHDGRTDLVVGIRGETRLYQNQTAKPGVRVRLSGPASNPYAIGAVIRPRGAAGFGPAVSIQAGAGFWSQNTLTPILTSPDAITALSVRWPNGKETVTPLKAEAGAQVVVAPE